jgi:hypothetical protein
LYFLGEATDGKYQEFKAAERSEGVLVALKMLLGQHF